MQNQEAFLEALRNGDQEEMNKVISSELNSKAKEEVDSIEESVAENLLNERVDFDMVFKAVAKHFDVDPEDVDSLDSDKQKEVYNMVDKCWDEDNDVVPDACPIDIGESVNEITDYNATSLHGSGGTVDGPSKSKQSAAANAATKMMSLQATNFNQMMSDIYSTDPDRARAFQDMIANNPGENTMKKIATDMMDNSDLAKVMKNYLGDYEKNVDIGTGDMDGKA